MFNYLKKQQYNYTIQWLPGSKLGVKNRVWKVEISQYGKVVLALESNDLDKLKEEIKHRLNIQTK